MRIRVWEGWRFQCSSASRKFLNEIIPRRLRVVPIRFSALQRAENSSIDRRTRQQQRRRRFSALQRAENSSIPLVQRERRRFDEVSVLFSEPKIPQSRRNSARAAWRSRFQCSSASRKFLNFIQPIAADVLSTFQCSSASRKFLNRVIAALAEATWVFQCSSASRKFLNISNALPSLYDRIDFSALQRAENSSMLNTAT